MTIDLVSVEACAADHSLAANCGDYENRDTFCVRDAESFSFDASTQEHLLIEFLHLTRSVAQLVRRSLRRHIEADGLVSAGIIGPVDAVHRYDITRHSQFVVHARLTNRGAVFDFLRSLDWNLGSFTDQVGHLVIRHWR